MVKPQELWALFKTCDDSRWLGDICRALGGQAVALDAGQMHTLKALEQGNEWHTEAVEERRRRERERKARYRERLAQSAHAEPNAQGTRKEPEAKGNLTPKKSDVPRRTASVLPTVDLSQVDISDEAFFSGQYDAVLMARKVTGDTGKGAGVYWRKWINEDPTKGESEFLEILFQFKREIQAGEDVENRGAAFTQRLKKWREGKRAKG